MVGAGGGRCRLHPRRVPPHLFQYVGRTLRVHLQRGARLSLKPGGRDPTRPSTDDRRRTMRETKQDMRPGALERRWFLQGASLAMLAGAGLLPARQTLAATQASWVGWQGYDDPLKA